MTQENVDLLLKDLCARLPYGVKVDVINEDNEHYIVKIGEGNIGHLGKGFWKECKPYLFPLSSMTEKQCFQLASIRSGYSDCWKYIKTPIPLHIANYEQIDWFNRNHFDYRGLIDKGLAIDATNLNIY